MFKKLLFILSIALTLSAEEEKISHIVLCWMDSTVTEAEVNTLIDETRKLDEIEGIEALTVGRPVPSERPIVDDSFTFGITMTFSSKEKMNNYLTDERHTSFVASKIKPKLKKLQVYDIISK